MMYRADGDVCFTFTQLLQNLVFRNSKTQNAPSIERQSSFETRVASFETGP
jgi:hypothetical protein